MPRASYASSAGKCAFLLAYAYFGSVSEQNTALSLSNLHPNERRTHTHSLHYRPRCRSKHLTGFTTRMRHRACQTTRRLSPIWTLTHHEAGLPTLQRTRPCAGSSTAAPSTGTRCSPRTWRTSGSRRSGPTSGPPPSTSPSDANLQPSSSWSTSRDRPWKTPGRVRTAPSGPRW